MTSNIPAIIAILRQYALDEVKKKKRQLKSDIAIYNKKFGPQDTKPLKEVIAFEQAAAALDIEQGIASKLVGNSDGSFPCPICLLRGKMNILDNSIRAGDGVLHCVICNSFFHVHS